jgi:uncharacterized protein
LTAAAAAAAAVETAAPKLAQGPQVVQGYRAGGFTIAGVRHEGSVLVFPDRVLKLAASTPAELDLAGLEPVRAAEPAPEILVVGTGAKFVPLPPGLRQAIRAWGVVAEAMATPAACRTYDVLLAEERRVAAALVAMPAEATG